MTTKSKYVPRVKKRTLLMAVGCVYTIGGGILMARAMVTLIQIHMHLPLEVVIGIIGGVFFYFMMFRKVFKRHYNRIIHLEIERPCFFSFFNARSYILMSVMITAGVTVRLTGLVPIEYLYTFYITMSLPLLVCAVRFFIEWSRNKELK
jgi:hypothetical protein